MVRSNVQLRWVLSSLLALTVALAGGMACGPVGGGAGYPGSLILDDAEFLLVSDVGSFLESRELPSVFLGSRTGTGEAQDRFLADWSRDHFAFVHPDEVSVMTNVLVPGESGHSVYTVFQGAFAAGDVIEAVEEAGYEEDDYRDFPVWVREPGGDVSLAVFEEDGFFVLGPDGEIRVFLKALDLEESFVSGEHGLRRVLDAAGEGLWSWAYGNCEGVFVDFLPRLTLGTFLAESGHTVDRLSGWAAETAGCEAAALTVTGGDEDTTLLTMAVLFTSERRAERGLEDLEERLEDSDEFDIDVEGARVRGELAVMELTIHE